MKKIIKNDSLDWFEEWKENFEKENNRKAHYKEDFATNDAEGIARRRRLREELLKEQGYICCYCMKRIDLDTSHIEHFWPKKFFGEKDLDYDNLFASCQGIETLDQNVDHCGHRKHDWWTESMISPTDYDIEEMFKYALNGEVHSVSERRESHIVDQMISEFGLNSYVLIRSRQEAIETSEAFDEDDYSDEDIRDFIEYYSNKNEGYYTPYCKAIVDALKMLL